MNVSDVTNPVIIERRFRGPPGSGNGGYSCAMLGRFIEGPAVVRLNIPPPLDTPLEVRRTDDGAELVYQGGDGPVTVASARPATIGLDIPAAPGFSEAQTASRRFRGFVNHWFPGCFVCGPQRDQGDGLRIFPGTLEDADGPAGMVAAAWIPDASLADRSGRVAPEFLWAALDCPGAYSFPEPQQRALMLGELAVSIEGSVAVGERCVVTGWETGRQGRKHFTGTALFGESGDCRAVGKATWFEVPLPADK